MRSLGITIGLLVSLASVNASAAELTSTEEARIDAWLDQLHERADDPLVLPTSGIEPTEVEGRPRLALARAIKTFEAQLDTAGAMAQGDALPLLLLARHYASVGLPVESVLWYDRALKANPNSENLGELLVERAAAAVASADSATVIEQAWNLTRRSDVGTYSTSLAQLLATARTVGGLASVNELTDALVGKAAKLDVRCVAELAWHRQESGRPKEARELWRSILVRDNPSAVRSVAMALRGLADTSFLLGDHRTAASLYRRYRIHDLGLLSAWSSYQLAGMAAASGNYSDAIAGFLSLCEREDPTPWKEESCWRLAQARQLIEIEDALRPLRRTLHGR